MLSPKQIAKMKSEIEVLEKAAEHCTDSDLKELIEAWIKDYKEKLESESQQH